MGAPLIIDDKALAALKEYGEAHPIPIAEVEKIIAGRLPCAGDRARHSLDIDFGYRLAFSVEERPLIDDSGTIWVRIMSMSARPGRVPNVHAIRLVSEQLGFPPLAECQVVPDGEVVTVAAELKKE